MRKLLISFVLGLTLTGCETLMPKKQVSVVPVWVLSAPADSREWFWGIGEGPDLDTAKRAALKDVAAKLRVSISGQLESRVRVDNNKVDRQGSTRITAEVQKTEFSHFAVEKTAQSGNGFFVLVKVDRLAFTRDLKTKLTDLDARIQSVTVGLNRKTPLERFVVLRGLQPSLEKAIGYTQLLMGAESGGDGAARLGHYESLQLHARQAITGLVFQIQAPPDDGDLVEAMGTFLNENGIRTTRVRGGNILAISSHTRVDEIYGSKMLKLKVTISLQDDQGRALASRDYSVSGSSAHDYRAARQNAIVKWVAAMREAGPVASLGFAE